MKNLICYMLGVLLLPIHASSQNASKPNVIIILVDDLGYNDVGFNGSIEIPTPQIDRIAKNGVKFTEGYVSYAVCGPSRAGLITGRYQQRFGFERNPLLAPNDPNMGLPLSEETLATVLGRNGYTNMAIGKWHLGAHKSLYPLKRGFDEFYGFLGGGHDYFPEKWVLNDISEITHQWDGYKTKLMRDNARVEESEYLTDALSREAVDFIDRNSKQPFFLYLAYNAPHTPMHATQKYLNRFSHIENEKRRTYAAMVSAVDDGVGLVLNKLEEKGISNNTMVFFLSDNGGPERANASDNGPLRGQKSDVFEGGIRVPFAMQWPGKISPGQIYKNQVISLDIFATAVARSNTEVNPEKPLDGVDLIPYLTGRQEGKPHHVLYWRKFDDHSHAVRIDDYKMVNNKGKGVALFNLAKDIGEQNPVVNGNKKIRQALIRESSAWESTLIDPIFLGLMHGEKYDSIYPARYKIINPFKPDDIEPAIPEGYKLVWQDEFNVNGKPDSSYWSYEYGFTRNRELQYYLPDNANCQNGVLVLEGKRERKKNEQYDPESKDWRRQWQYADYTAASITTKRKFNFQYGIMEVRAKIDTAMGMWPAIWTLGTTLPWPANGEIDLMEFYRKNGKPVILANAAWGDVPGKVVWDSEIVPYEHFSKKEIDWYKKFHVWKMDWTQERIRLYLDDELLNEVDLSKTLNSDGFNPFQQQHYILLNLAIGSNGDDPSNTTFPRRYEVDYVRVYQRK